MMFVNVADGSIGLPRIIEIEQQPFQRGGEGALYLSKDRQFVVKVYHRRKSERQTHLHNILDFVKQIGETESIAWPLGIVESIGDKACLGVVTRRVPESFANLSEFIHDQEIAASHFGKNINWLDFLKIARSTADTIQYIHGLGAAHGDITSANVLADLSLGKVVLIDVDGLVVTGHIPPQVLGTPRFVAPEILRGEARPDVLSDRYSTAVLILWTLLFRDVMAPQRCYDPDDATRDDLLGYGQYACFSENSIDHRNWFRQIGQPLLEQGALSYRTLSPRLQNLTTQALETGLFEPQLRPSVREWSEALAEVYDILLPCWNCKQSFIYPYWRHQLLRSCPFCGTVVTRRQPAVLELFEALGPNQFEVARNLILFHGVPLFADVVESHSRPPFSRKQTPIIGSVTWDTSTHLHRVINQSSEVWSLEAGGVDDIKPGASLLLAPGTVFSFGPGKRVARVVEG